MATGGIPKLQAEASLNAQPFKDGADQVKAAGKQLADDLKKSGSEGSKAFDQIPERGEQAAVKLDRATKSMIASIERATAAAKTGGRNTAEFFDALASQRGVNANALRPYIDQLRLAEQAQAAASAGLGKMEMSAKQTRAALAQVPAQFTDIVTSLASGSPPLTVLIQQGGQLKDTFGGIGPAAQALGGYITALINPVTIAAAALGTLAFGFIKGREEQTEFVRATVLTGYAAGVTASQLSAMAASIDKMGGGTQARAAEVLSAMARAGGVGAENLQRFASAAIELERVGGPAAEETAKAFAELGRAPLEASLKLNQSTNFLTRSTYEQIRALEEQGRTVEAAKVAQDAYASTVEQRAPEILTQLGYVERAWKGITDAGKEAIDALREVGRPGNPIADEIAAIEARIAQNNQQRGSAGEYGQAAIDKGNAALTERLRILQQAAGFEALGAAYENKKKKDIESQVELDKLVAASRTKAQRAELEFAQAIAKLNAANASPEVRAAVLGAIAEKYKENTKSVRENNDAQRANAAILAELAGVSSNYVQNLQEYAAARNANVISEEQYLGLVDNLLAKQPAVVAAQKAATDVAKQRAAARQAESDGIDSYLDKLEKERAATLKSVTDRTQSLQTEAEAIGIATRQNISLAEAIEQVNIARLREELRRYTDGSEAYKAVEREIQAREKLLELMGNQRMRQAGEQSAKDTAAAYDRAAQQIEQALTDALMAGGKSGKEYIEGLFRAMVLRPVVQAIVQPVAGLVQSTIGSALGNSFGASAGTSMLGNAIGTAIGSTIFGSNAAYAAAIGTTNFAAGSQAAMLAAQTQGFGAAGLTATSSAAAGAGSGFMSTAAAAGPYVLAALAVLNAAGVFRSRKIVGGGLTGTLGEGDIQSYDLQRRGGTLFDGPDYRMVNQRVTDESQAIQAAYDALRTNAAAMAEALGVGGDAVKKFTTVLGTDIVQNDIGLRGIKLDGLTPEQAAQKVQQALASANEDLAAFVLGARRTVTETVTEMVERWQDATTDYGTGGMVMEERTREITRTIEAVGPSYAKLGETAVQTLERLSGSISTINPVLEALGLTMFDTSLAGADLASKLADAIGGLNNFSQAAGSYYENFFSEAERTANATQRLTESLAAMGLTVPTTREAYRALVEAQDLSTDAGRKNVAQLLLLSGAFAELVPATVAAADATDKAAQALRTAADIANERASLERELLTLQGDTAALRALERAALDESNRALYDQIKALEDSQAAAAAAADQERTLAAERERIASERGGLERQLLELQGDAASIRALERAALDETNRALYDQIQALQDSQAAAAAAADQERTLAAERERVASERAGLERQLLQALGDTAALRAQERASLDASNRALYDQIQALQDAADAAKAYNDALANARAAADRAMSAVGTAQSAVDAILGRATDAYLSAQDRVASATARIAQIQAQAADSARQAALRMRELGQSLQDFVSGETVNPSAAFGQALRNALAGDQAAMQQLPGLANSAIEAARSNATTTAQAAIERARILAGVAEVARNALATRVPDAVAEDPLAAARADLAKAQADLASALAVAQQIGAPLVRSVEDLVAQFTTAQADLVAARADYAAAQATLAKIEKNTGDTAIKTGDTAANALATASKIDGLPQELASAIGTLSVAGSVTFDPSAGLLSVFNAIKENTAQMTLALWGATASTRTGGGRTDIMTTSLAYLDGARFTGLAGVMQTGLESVTATLNYWLSDLTAYASELLGMADGDGLRIKFDRGTAGGLFEPGGNVFAKGGAFTNGIVTRPTAFPMGLMGEADPEAIMPLAQMPGGSLGVRAVGGGSDRAMVAELRALKAHMEQMNQQMAQLQRHARRTADAVNGNPEQPMLVEAVS